MGDRLLEVLVVLGHSTRAQLAIVLGVTFFVGLMLAGHLLVGRLELPGLLSAVTEALRAHLMQRYDMAAWAALGGFASVAIKAYRRDRRRLLGA